MLMQRIGALLVAGLLSLAAQAGGYNIKPGMWETTMEMEIVGLPPEMARMMPQKQPETERECVQSRDFEFKAEDMGEECTFNKIEESASRVVWEIKCQTEAGTSTGKGEANYRGTTTDGWFEMDVQGGPMGGMKMRSTFKGKRVGSC